MQFKEFMMNLFRRKGPQQVITALPEPERQLYLMQDVDAPMDVYGKDGRKLCSCRIKEYTAYQIKLERLPGEISLPILNERDQVRLMGYTTDLKNLDLQGTVSKSTRLELDVNQIRRRSYDNVRIAFRQPVDAPAEVYTDVKDLFKSPEKCMLVNISTDGACITSDHEYEMNQPILLRVELFPGAGPISFKGQVIRIAEYGDGTEYGIIFAQLTHRKRNDLIRDMEELRERTTKETNR